MRLGLLKTPDQTTKQRGFTIVELLIVIVIIGVLATITIVGYNGITKRAHAVSLQSDLKNGATALGVSQATNGQYPATGAQANNGQGLQASPGNTFAYSVSGDGSSYCLSATGFGMSYSITNNDQTPQPGHCNGGVVTTLAGNGTAGYADGAGTAAEFSYPYGIAVDPSGIVYVSDNDSGCIRKITPAAVVTTFAGTCAADGSTQGFANGTGAAAKFNYPYGITIDASGNVYVADTSNNCIRKITSAAVVTTLAGTCNNNSNGSANGTGAAAQFYGPEDIALDTSGNFYVTDQYNNCIRKITSASVVTTFAGTCAADDSTYGSANGTGAAAQFYGPGDIALDTSGNFYVTDQYNNCIRKITSASVVTTFAGTCAADGSTYGFANGTGAAAQFNNPNGVAVDASDTVYVADMSNQCIRKITSAAVVTTLAGSCGNTYSTPGYADGTGSAAKFSYPGGITIGASGTLYVAGSGNNRIRMIK